MLAGGGEHQVRTRPTPASANILNALLYARHCAEGFAHTVSSFSEQVRAFFFCWVALTFQVQNKAPSPTH